MFQLENLLYSFQGNQTDLLRPWSPSDLNVLLCQIQTRGRKEGASRRKTQLRQGWSVLPYLMFSVLVFCCLDVNSACAKSAKSGEIDGAELWMQKMAPLTFGVCGVCWSVVGPAEERLWTWRDERAGMY